MDDQSDIFMKTYTEESDIGHYFNQEVSESQDSFNQLFDMRQVVNTEDNQNNRKSSKAQSDQLQKVEEIEQACVISNSLRNKKQKSIFHNFQKHLICLIKNNMALPTLKHSVNAVHKLAVNIWKSFLKTKSYNKKVLHMLFGVETSISFEMQLSKISVQFPAFSMIIQKNPVQTIKEAQQYLRAHLLQKANSWGKEQLKVRCSMAKFQQFYEYFKSLMSEIANGSMSRRMTKTRKIEIRSHLQC